RTGLENIRTQAGVPVQVFFYPAGHAFFNDTNLIGTYDADAAKTAWHRTLEFLHSALAQHEKSPAS
ncbi:MAG: dienelactone hydrolase family protein, partial [Solirubrobacteraceae bacterium]